MYGVHIEVFTDYKILQYAFAQEELNLQKRIWLEFLDYDMTMLYHPNKANVVVEVLSRLFMGSVVHVDEEREELVKDIDQLVRLGV